MIDDAKVMKVGEWVVRFDEATILLAELEARAKLWADGGG